MRKIVVGMSNFWPGFDYRCNFLTDTLEGSGFFTVVQVEDKYNPELHDLAIFSVFGKRPPSRKIPSVLFLGENIRPDYCLANTSLSTDFSDYNGRNFYYPAWLGEINWHVNSAEMHNFYRTEENRRLSGEAVQDWMRRKSEIIAIFNNRDLKRIYDINQLSKILPVSTYGKYWEKQFTPGMNAKLQLCSAYKFHYCSENSYWPGYLTEKIFHAYLAGCIPIYDGRNDVGTFLDQSSFINLADYDSRPEDLLVLIHKLVNDEDLASQYLMTKLFTSNFTLNAVMINILKACFRALSLHGQIPKVLREGENE